jgi:hypothetical protein
MVKASPDAWRFVIHPVTSDTLPGMFEDLRIEREAILL